MYILNPKGYIQPIVREVFKDLTDEPSGSKDFKIATKFVSRYLEKLEKGEFDLEENCWKNKDCVMGASPPSPSPSITQDKFERGE